MTPLAKAHRVFSFGPFRVDLFERVLTRDGKAISLAPKLFDTLAVLVENSGHVVEKDQMMERLWKDTFVEESSLSQNIFQLRKVLKSGSSGRDYIETVPKRGYRFALVVPDDLPNESLHLKVTDTTNTESRQAYLLGTYFSNKRTGEALAKSIDYFHEAIVLDPEFGRAHAGLADSYFWLAYSEVDPEFRQESFELSRASAIKAIELDPTSAEGHAALATVKIKHDHDAVGAEDSFRKAISSDPNSGMAHSRYAYFLAAMGRIDEAFTMIRQTHDIDPLSPDANASLAMILYMRRHYDEAVRYCRTALALEPSFAEALLLLGRCYQQKGMFKEASVQYEKAGSGAAVESNELIANLHALTGKRVLAESILSELMATAAPGEIRPFNIAAVYAALGNENAAFEWLERPFINWTERLRMLRFDPRLDTLRPDPRFAEIIEHAMSPMGIKQRVHIASANGRPATQVNVIDQQLQYDN